MSGSESFGRESVVRRLETGTVTSPGVPHEGSGGAIPMDSSKYTVDATIGAGGMGEVMLVRDLDLRREVAMKVMKRDLADDESHRMKFVAEAQATSQLEHPGIPPVHDLGLTEDGAPYFTMKLVRGQTLRDVLHNLLLGRREFRREFSLHRLIGMLERICETLHFAHEKGVLHRDLKPSNVMLGDFGEVHVMDWGIARLRGEPVDPEDEVGTVGTDAGLQTVDGAIKGTPPYMSPEQASGLVSSMDRRSDVWALGCLLYEILTLHRAFAGDDVLDRVRRGQCPPVRTRNPHRHVPEDLAALCDRCLSVDPCGRPSSAREVADVLRAWLDGSADRERRFREADHRAAEGAQAVARYESLRGKLASAETRAETMARGYEPWQSVEECLPLLLAREHVVRTRKSMRGAFSLATKTLEAALLAREDHPGARASLVELWSGRLAEAESRGDVLEAEQALDMITRYHEGGRAGIVAGHGSLSLVSEPAGADVTLIRLEDRHGVLHEGDHRELGCTPVGPVALEMGSWVCVLRHEGYRDVRYPVYIVRNLAWEGVVRLRTEEDLGEDQVLVPGGPFLYGEGEHRRTVVLEDFVIGRHPVTFRQWAAFLAAVEDAQGREAASALVPGTTADGPYMERRDDGAWQCLPNNVEGPARVRCLEQWGEDFEMLLPVSGVSWADAAAYCAWRRDVTGLEWRLPTEEEREKAARGVDGRRFPWGDLEHASLAKCRTSRDEMPQPEPVGAFPTAMSVYGMADAAGNSWDWTDSWSDGSRFARVLRGGGWLNVPSDLRCARRESSHPSLRDSAGGFRIARSL